MQNNWPTQTQDMEEAEIIINRHLDFSEGEALGLIEVVVDKEKQKAVEVRIPDWMHELINFFCDKYGHGDGQLVASKVITRVLLKSETVH